MTAFNAPASEVLQGIPILQKPFRRDALLSALETALKQGRANALATPV